MADPFSIKDSAGQRDLITFGRGPASIYGPLTVSTDILLQGKSVLAAITSDSWFEAASYPTTQAAVDAANAAGGGVVHFAPGTYGPITTLYSNITLLGDGRSVSVIEQPSTTANGINWAAENFEYLTMSGLQIVGPGSGSGSGISMVASGAGNPNILGCHFSDMLIHGFGGTGIAEEILIVSELDNVIVASCGANGISLAGGTNTSVTLNSCYANDNTDSGYDLEQCTYTTLNSCAADSNQVGYFLYNCTGVTLNGCGAESSPYGFKIQGGSGITLVNCFTYNNSGVSFWVTGDAANVTLIGCSENDPDGATASFQFDAGTDVNVIGWSYVTAPVQTSVANQLNDGSGNFQAAGASYLNGVANLYGGSSTSVTAAASTPSLSTGVAAQINTSQDVLLYADVHTASVFSLAIGPTSTPATTIVTSATNAIGLVSVRVPAGWYVKSTFTSADVTWTAVTC
jgi:hypothetical protein